MQAMLQALGQFGQAQVRLLSQPLAQMLLRVVINARRPAATVRLGRYIARLTCADKELFHKRNTHAEQFGHLGLRSHSAFVRLHNLLA